MRNATSGNAGWKNSLHLSKTILHDGGIENRLCPKHGNTPHKRERRAKAGGTYTWGPWKCQACARDRQRPEDAALLAERRRAIEAHQEKIREQDYWGDIA